MKQDRPNIIVLPPLALLAAILLTMALRFWLPLGVLIQIRPEVIVAFGSVVMAVALWINVTGFRAFKRAGTNVNPYRPSLKIVRDGPFRFTRNPMYLGMITFVAGFGTAMATLWGPIVAGGLWALLHWGVVLREEQYLTAKFGADYSALLSATRRWL